MGKIKVVTKEHGRVVDTKWVDDGKDDEMLKEDMPELKKTKIKENKEDD